MNDSYAPLTLEVLADERAGEGGFLHIRRMTLRNVRPDGSRSAPFHLDFVERDKGLDAVALLLYRDGARGPEVMLRDGMRPAIVYGRPADRVPLPETRTSIWFTEVVAGIVEEGEVGEAALRRRAADEAWEEAGARLDPAAIELLGSSFPSPGLTAERFFFAAAKLPPGATLAAAEGDGSPMEEGSRVRFVALDDAIAACVRGEIEDAKTEIVLRRLADRLRAPTR